jgi:hypothetical protein
MYKVPSLSTVLSSPHETVARLGESFKRTLAGVSCPVCGHEEFKLSTKLGPALIY